MWEGHIGSKGHRVAVSKLREKELLEEEGRKAAEKRKMEEEEEEEDSLSGSSSKKRRVSEEVEDGPPSKSKASKGGFPANFFSDPSRTIPVTAEDEEEDEGNVTAPPPSESESKSKTQLDLEWEAFQAALQQTPAEEEKEDERMDAYNRATVAVEAELVSNANEGLPQLAPDGEDTEVPQKEEETEDEIRKRKEREDRELIMDRLIEEERAQEEADSRVSLLKAKLEAAKKARIEKKKKA